MTTHIPDQSGRTVIITGGSSGIGKATAAALAAKGARVILAVRDQTRGRAAAAEMGDLAESRPLDLGSLDSVREFAGTVDAPVDYLINNAGSMTATLRHTTDGFESQFGINHLGHFALTNLLLSQVTGRVITGRRLLDHTLALGTRLLAQGPEGGARPTLLATVGDVPGGSFSGPSRFGVRGPAALEELTGNALDDDIAHKLWEVSERLTQVEFPMPGHETGCPR